MTFEPNPDKTFLHDLGGIDFSLSVKSIGEGLLARESFDVELIELKSRNSISKIRELFPTGCLYVCDFYLGDIEKSLEIESGYYDKNSDIKNIDHHAPSKEMYRFISSGNLAAIEVAKNGAVDNDSTVIINHTDCDSMISSLIIRGYIPPIKLFTDAVIAADHLGETNPISDLLQALEIKRDYNFSVRNLGLFLTGRGLDKEAQEILDRRLEGRIKTEEAIRSGDVRIEDGVALLRLSKGMRNEYLPALLPDAAVILTYEDGKDSDTLITRCRLGKNLPKGLTIFSLGITDFDPGYGGRWNAGSNKRGGGTNIPIEEYYNKLKQALASYSQEAL